MPSPWPEPPSWTLGPWLLRERAPGAPSAVPLPRGQRGPPHTWLRPRPPPHFRSPPQASVTPGSASRSPCLCPAVPPARAPDSSHSVMSPRLCSVPPQHPHPHNPPPGFLPALPEAHSTSACWVSPRPLRCCWPVIPLSVYHLSRRLCRRKGLLLSGQQRSPGLGPVQGTQSPVRPSSPCGQAGARPLSRSPQCCPQLTCVLAQAAGTAPQMLTWARCWK